MKIKELTIETNDVCVCFNNGDLHWSDMCPVYEAIEKYGDKDVVEYFTQDNMTFIHVKED